jgi:hypothetical protein
VLKVPESPEPKATPLLGWLKGAAWPGALMGEALIGACVEIIELKHRTEGSSIRTGLAKVEAFDSATEMYTLVLDGAVQSSIAVKRWSFVNLGEYDKEYELSLDREKTGEDVRKLSDAIALFSESPRPGSIITDERSQYQYRVLQIANSEGYIKTERVHHRSY